MDEQWLEELRKAAISALSDLTDALITVESHPSEAAQSILTAINKITKAMID